MLIVFAPSHARSALPADPLTAEVSRTTTGAAPSGRLAAMFSRTWRSLVAVVAAIGAFGTATALARSPHLPTNARLARHGGPLSGRWTGYISRQTSYGTRRQRITITINARETRGSWKLGARCYGPLTLDSISGGYHHYLRHVARGASCAGGDVDCLKRAGAALYDAVTSHLGGAWDTSGTLRRVRS